MNEKHTPGPWKVGNDSERVLDANGFALAQTGQDLVCENWPKTGARHWSEKPGVAFREISEQESEANARLIASAPELLVQLEYWTMVIDPNNTVRELDQARAVIAKARGT